MADNFVGIFVTGSYLYKINADNGDFVIDDISIPLSPSAAVGTLSLGFTPTCINTFHHKAYVGGSTGELSCINIDDPTNPIEEFQITTSDQINNITIVESFIFLSCSSSIFIYDLDGNSILSFPQVATRISIQDRRAFFGVGSTLYNYRIGGFYCPFILTGSLRADEIFFEFLRGRNAYLKGGLIANSLTVYGSANDTTSGSINASNYYSLKQVYFLSGVGDPNGVYTIPDGCSIGFFFSDGSNPFVLWFTSDGGTTWTGIA